MRPKNRRWPSLPFAVAANEAPPKWELPWRPFSLQPYLSAGYRVAAFDRSSSGDQIELQFRGPTAGMGVTF